MVKPGPAIRQRTEVSHNTTRRRMVYASLGDLCTNAEMP